MSALLLLLLTTIHTRETIQKMSELPDQLKCTITDWALVYDLCRDVSDQVRETGFNPDIVVALARGGWVAGRCVCDFLDINDLTSLKIERSDGVGQKEGKPTVRYPISKESVEGKDVLLVDEIAATGESLRLAVKYTQKHDPAEIQTSTLHVRDGSEFTPNYVGEQVEEVTWMIYPWNFIENLSDLIRDAGSRSDMHEFRTTEMQRFLRDHYQINNCEQLNRLGEVLHEMEKREEIEFVAADLWRFPESTLE